MAKAATPSLFNNDFIHFQGVTFNRGHILVISGPSVEMGPDGKPKPMNPFFTVHMAHGVNWRFEAGSEAELLKIRNELIAAL